MRIIHLINAGDVGGANRHVLSLAQELSKQIEVKVISLHHSAFADDGHRMGLDIQVVHSNNIVHDIIQIAAIVKQGGYDVVHSHGTKANIISALIKQTVLRPTVTTVHSDYRLDYLHSLPRRYSLGLLNRLTLTHMDYFISVSNTIRELLIGRGVAEGRIMSINNSIDFDIQMPIASRKEFTEKYGLTQSSNDTIIGILARLTPVKDVATFLKAAREVVQKNQSVKFIIAGDGEERIALEALTRNLGIVDYVSFIGFISDTDQFLANIDISVLTSISEGFPFSIIEAARLKKPTISSAVGGIPDLIESGVNGYLFAPGDHKSLAQHMLTLSGDVSTRVDMGERVYVKAKVDFSLKTMCKKQLSIYSHILKHR